MCSSKINNYIIVGGHRRSDRICCLCLQDLPWTWKRGVPPKPFYPPTKLGDVSTQKTAIWTVNFLDSFLNEWRLFNSRLSDVGSDNGMKGRGIRTPLRKTSTKETFLYNLQSKWGSGMEWTHCCVNLIGKWTVLADILRIMCIMRYLYMQRTVT
jgi:hypothetical protein